jgi:hypothetical protein
LLPEEERLGKKEKVHWKQRHPFFLITFEKTLDKGKKRRSREIAPLTKVECGMRPLPKCSTAFHHFTSTIPKAKYQNSVTTMMLKVRFICLSNQIEKPTRGKTESHRRIDDLYMLG